MVRMSDILKNAGDRKDKERKDGEGKETPRREPQLSVPRPQEPEKEEPKNKKSKSGLIRISEAMGKAKAPREDGEVRVSSAMMGDIKMTLGNEITEKLYEEALSLTQEILKEDNTDYAAIDINGIKARIKKIIGQLKSNDKDDMLLLAVIKNPGDIHRHYLSHHSLNTCIFSIEIGLALGYDNPELIELGTLAILHDIGMLRYMHLADQERKLTDAELDEIKKHAVEGSGILEKVEGMTERDVHVVAQHHEHIDGSGYPLGLNQESIGEYARIIGVADVFEAMIHPRPHRSERTSLEAIEEILKHKKAFEYKIVKILMENIGIFPVGCFVRLNTKEIAQVAKLNHKFPLRPVVHVIAAADGKKLQEARRVDLISEPGIYIVSGVRKEKFNV